MSTDGVVVEHTTVAPVGPVTVHDIDPAGSGFATEVPATRAVKVEVPPRVGELEALREIVGTRVEIPKVTELEVTEV